jgi:predicted  nucleic acid-binding Zn-ribbon protein
MRGVTLKEQLALLRELQRIDLELDALTAQRTQIEDRLTEHRTVLARLTEELNHQKKELDEIRVHQRQKELDFKEAQDNLKERKKRLLNVGSTKEYNAVEKEVETLQKTADVAEEEMLHLAEVIENTERSIREKEDKVAELRESIQLEEQDSLDALNTLTVKIADLKGIAYDSRGAVSKRVLHKYDFIRSRRAGVALVAARNGHCEGCYMSLPPQLFIQIQRGESLESCPSCQRILFYEEDAPAARSAMA